MSHTMSLGTRERTYAEMVARDIHPDLYEGVRESEELREMRKRYTWADQMDDLRRIYLDFDIDLPYQIGATYFSCNVGFGKSLDREASLARLRDAVQRVKRLGAKITKEFVNENLLVRGEFPSGLRISLSVDRGVVCEKGTKGCTIVHPLVPERDANQLRALKDEILAEIERIEATPGGR